MTDKELKQIHNKILEIVIYFDNFCKENQITYYLMGGTALGAIRHKGFIPWDDDFDVFMDAENYTKFRKVIKEKIDSETYYFQEEDTKEWPMFFSKLKMHGTTYIEKDVRHRKDMHHGLFLDIMPLNNVATSKTARYLQYLAARIANTRALIDKGYDTDSTVKKIALQLSKIIVTPFVKRKLVQYVRRYNKKNTEYVGHFFGRARFDK
ncbi:MAG: LicD family protein, partial [Bacteroidota bacterium]